MGKFTGFSAICACALLIVGCQAAPEFTF